MRPVRQLLAAYRRADAAARFTYAVRQQACLPGFVCAYAAFNAFRFEFRRPVAQAGGVVLALSLAGQLAWALYLLLTR